MKSQLTHRKIILILFGLQIAGQLMALVSVLVTPPPEQMLMILVSGGGLIVTAILMYAYWRGWDYARHLLVGMFTLLVPLAFQEPYLTQEPLFMVLAPPVLALIVGSPSWVLISGATILVLILLRAGGEGIYTSPRIVIPYVMLIGGMVLSRLSVDTAQRLAEANAQAEEANAQAKRNAEELARKAEELEQQNEQQQQLLDLVAALETPAVPLVEGILFVPIVGHIDNERMGRLTTRLLYDASAQRARVVILDIAGVPMMDLFVARGLVQTAQSLRLLGCEVAMSGISAQVASTLTQLDVDLSQIRTMRGPQELLMEHMNGARRL
jgi:anti-anti-sigma regulatory factor